MGQRRSVSSSADPWRNGAASSSLISRRPDGNASRLWAFWSAPAAASGLLGNPSIFKLGFLRASSSWCCCSTPSAVAHDGDGLLSALGSAYDGLRGSSSSCACS